MQASKLLGFVHVGTFVQHHLRGNRCFAINYKWRKNKDHTVRYLDNHSCEGLKGLFYKYVNYAKTQD